ncbi:MAG: hypothetical protein ACOCTT_02035 [archaeon]
MELRRILYAFIGLFLFILSIVILKDSTKFLLPLFETYIPHVDSPIASFGFGWFLSYVMLSGAPPAILSLNLLHVGVLTTVSSYMMVMGTRFGAAFILVLIGLLEYFRGRSDSLADSTSIAFLSFIITYTVFVPALFLGRIFLSSPLIDMSIYSPGFLVFGIDGFFSVFSSRFLSLLGALPSFFASLFLLVIGLSVFNKTFENIEPYRFKSSIIAFAMRHKWYSFFIGVFITLISGSVSISLGVLVPLYNLGYLERKNLIPYIMGANVATFISHFVASMLLESSIAFNLVLAATVASLIITLIYLYFYGYYSKFIKKSINFILLRPSLLIIFTLFLIAFPLSLIILGSIISI